MRIGRTTRILNKDNNGLRSSLSDNDDNDNDYYHHNGDNDILLSNNLVEQRV